MRVLVVSDTHGDEYALRRALAEQPEAQLVIHLGDGTREALRVADDFPDRRFLMVLGNNDFWGSSGVSDTEIALAAGRRIFCTHGHRYDVKSGIYRLICAAREQKADIVLFGHTHIPVTDYDDGLYILNPGSLSHGRSSYGLLDITNAGIVPFLVELRS